MPRLAWADHALKRFEQRNAAGPNVRPLEYGKTADWIAMAAGTLINDKMNITRMTTNSLPFFLVVHLSAGRLLVQVVQAVLELRVRNTAAKAGHRPELVHARFPTVVVVLPVNGGPTTIGRARRSHDNDEHLVRAAVMPERRLLLNPCEVRAADYVEIGSAPGGPTAHQDMRRAPKSAADLAYIISRR